jgi:hypothetical protein
VLVEASRWQACEAELLQAVDRLRLVHHQGEPKSVYLLTCVPLPLPIDEVTTLDALAGTKAELLLERFGIVVLWPRWLAEHAPDLFPSVRTAERWVAEVRSSAKRLNSILSQMAELLPGKFRPSGQGARDVDFRVPADHPMPRSALAALVGELSLYEGPDDLHGEVRLPPERVRVIPIDASFLADLRPLSPGSDLLVPAVLLDLGGNPEVRLQ